MNSSQCMKLWSVKLVIDTLIDNALSSLQVSLLQALLVFASLISLSLKASLHGAYYCMELTA